LIALFDLFDIDHLIAAEGALRHGVLYDLLDRRLDATDMRRKTVRRMMQMYGVDTAQSLRVRNVSLHLFSQITPVESEIDYSRLSRKLGWAADLHEIGSHISHSDYHKHGAYILDSAEAMGFAAHEMHRLSLLILGQKGKLRKLGEALNDCYLTEQLLCLRLGLIACHARNTVDWQQVELSKKGSQFNLTIPGVWQLRYPQSVHLLLQEVSAWSKTPWQFKLNQV
jgi:exopolyphosphatase/guanosine-5'-triphosphate,3'-diphosphate pyrophosphatase